MQHGRLNCTFALPCSWQFYSHPSPLQLCALSTIQFNPGGTPNSNNTNNNTNITGPGCSQLRHECYSLHRSGAGSWQDIQVRARNKRAHVVVACGDSTFCHQHSALSATAAQTNTQHFFLPPTNPPLLPPLLPTNKHACLKTGRRVS